MVLSSAIPLLPLTPDHYPSYQLETSMDGMTYGQQVYFLGFPAGKDGGLHDITRGFPMPFVRMGILASIGQGGEFNISGEGYLGFSGGPVVFPTEPTLNKDFQVAGIISHIPVAKNPVVNEHGGSYSR